MVKLTILGQVVRMHTLHNLVYVTTERNWSYLSEITTKWHVNKITVFQKLFVLSHLSF